MRAWLVLAADSGMGRIVRASIVKSVYAESRIQVKQPVQINIQRNVL
jgi:hypothetical protein